MIRCPGFFLTVAIALFVVPRPAAAEEWRDGGKLLLTVPFAWDEHEQPWDFARYTSFGLRHLLAKRSFNILESRKTASDIRVVIQMFNNYLYKTFVGSNLWCNIFLVPLIIGPFNILGTVLARVLPRNPDFYLDNILMAEKPKRQV